MFTIDNLLIAIGIAYFTEVVFLGFALGTRWLCPSEKITSFRRACSVLMFVDATALLISLTFTPDGILSSYEGGLINAIDGIVLWFILIAGITITSKPLFTNKGIALFGLPYLATLLYQLFLASNKYPIGAIVILISGAVEIAILAARLHKFDKNLKDHISNMENRTTTWFIVFMSCVFLEMLAWFVLHALCGSNKVLWFIYDMFVMALYAILGHFAMIQEEAAIEPIEDEPVPIEVPQSSLAKDIEELMTNKRAYLDPDLSIESIAEALCSNTTYVYKSIHDEMGSTFYDYVNGYRIEAAKKRLLETSDKIEAIALSCGFNSSRSFQRVFKRFHDTTPTEWRNSMKS